MQTLTKKILYNQTANTSLTWLLPTCIYWPYSDYIFPFLDVFLFLEYGNLNNSSEPLFLLSRIHFFAVIHTAIIQLVSMSQPKSHLLDYIYLIILVCCLPAHMIPSIFPQLMSFIKLNNIMYFQFFFVFMILYIFPLFGLSFILGQVLILIGYLYFLQQWLADGNIK